LFIEIIVSPSSIPVFSYGLYFLLSIPSISDIPTTNTPLVYNFIPATLPTGITVVLGNTSTVTSFTNIFSNKLNFTFFFPVSLITFDWLFDNVSITSLLSTKSAFKPNIVLSPIFSPSKITILSGIACIDTTYIYTTNKIIIKIIPFIFFVVFNIFSLLIFYYYCLFYKFYSKRKFKIFYLNKKMRQFVLSQIVLHF